MRELLEYEEEVPGKPGWIQINHKKTYWRNKNDSRCTQCKCRLSDHDLFNLTPWDWHTLCWMCKEKWWQPIYQWFVDKDMKFYLWRFHMKRLLWRKFNKKRQPHPNETAPNSNC